MKKIHGIIAALSVLALLGCAKEPVFPGMVAGDDPPEIYSWMKHNVRKCEVRYKGGVAVQCSQFSREKLDELRVNYTDPYRKT